MAINRLRFRRRIQQTELILAPSFERGTQTYDSYAQMWHLDTKHLYLIYVCVFNKEKRCNSIKPSRLFLPCLRTILLRHTTYQFMHNYIVQSSILSKIAQKTTHVNTSTSKNTKACTIMSIKSTDNTLQLSTIISPFAKCVRSCNVHIVK